VDPLISKSLSAHGKTTMLGALFNGIASIFDTIFGSQQTVPPRQTKSKTSGTKGEKEKRHIPGWKATREKVWAHYFGSKSVGKCYCCSIRIYKDWHVDKKGWHCSHVVAYSLGGSNELPNLRCCCRTCNLSMGTKNLYVYKKELLAGRRRR